MTLEEWTAEVRVAFGLDHNIDVDLVLDVARDAAQAIARPAAPLTTFLVGLAAGRAGGSEDDVKAAAAKIQALIAGHQQPQ